MQTQNMQQSIKNVLVVSLMCKSGEDISMFLPVINISLKIKNFVLRNIYIPLNNSKIGGIEFRLMNHLKTKKYVKILTINLI